MMTPTQSTANARKKLAKILTVEGKKTQERRVAETLATLVSALALQCATKPSTPVCKHLSVVLGVQNTEQMNLNDLITIEKSGDAITASILRPDTGLTFRDFLALACDQKITSGDLAEALNGQVLTIRTQAFRDALATWKNASAFNKHLLLAMAAEYAGMQAHSVCVRFAPNRAERLMESFQAGKPLGDRLRNDLGRLSMLGPTCLTLELTPDEKKEPHVHGLILGDLDEDFRKALADALYSLVGSKTFRKSRPSSTKAVPTYFNPGAVLYMFKNLGDAGLPEDPSTTFMSNDASRIGREYRDLLVMAVGDILGDPNWMRGRPSITSGPLVEALALVELPEPPAQAGGRDHSRLLKSLHASLEKLQRRPREPVPPRTPAPNPSPITPAPELITCNGAPGAMSAREPEPNEEEFIDDEAWLERVAKEAMAEQLALEERQPRPEGASAKRVLSAEKAGQPVSTALSTQRAADESEDEELAKLLALLDAPDEDDNQEPMTFAKLQEARRRGSKSWNRPPREYPDADPELQMLLRATA